MSEPAKPKRIYERANEPKVTISVVLLESERDELAMWAREMGVSMSTYLRWHVQNEAVTRFLSIAKLTRAASLLPRFKPIGRDARRREQSPKLR